MFQYVEIADDLLVGAFRELVRYQADDHVLG
jgi:hypothetical protein